jgi:hypothetical protein
LEERLRALRAVEDLLWLLLTSPAGGNFDQFFVHWLDETVIRVPSLDRKPDAPPWLGDFGIRTRRGLILHLAVLLGGDLIRQRLTYSGSHEAFEKALKMLRPKEALEFKKRSARWPQMLKNLVFERQSTH